MNKYVQNKKYDIQIQYKLLLKLEITQIQNCLNMIKYLENAILKQVLNCDNELKQVYSAYSIRLPRKKLITTIKNLVI